MSIYLAYIVLVQIITIVFFNRYNLLFLLILLILLIFLIMKKKWPLIFICIITIFITSSICIFQNNKKNSPKPKPSQTVRGAIITNPIIDGNKVSFIIKLHNQKILLNSFANSKEQLKIFQKRKIGEVCEVNGEVTLPLANSNPYLFNYKKYLLNQDIHWVITANQHSLMNCNNGSRSILESIIYSRHALTKYVEDNFNSNTEGYINALLFGDRLKMDANVESQYQVVGIVHLLAISGSHISLLSLGVYFLLIRIGVTKETSLLITIICIITYGFLAGASASVVRAVIIGVLVGLFKLAKKKVDIASLLFISCIIMLLLKPNYIDDIGFQFSFVTTFVLVLCSDQILYYSSWYAKGLFTSSITQLVSIPILLFNFHELSPYSILINLLFIPFISFIIMPLCIICFSLSFINLEISEYLALVLMFFINISDQLLSICMQLPFIKLIFIHPSGGILSLYVVLIFFILYFMENKKEKKLTIYCFIGFFILMTGHLFYPFINPVGKIMFIDVGQGDCILIKLPFNRGNYVIDTGGKLSGNEESWMKRKNQFSTGEDILIPILKGEGISEVDKLIFTHGDIDHIGGGKEVLQSFPVKQLIVGDKVEFTPAEAERISIAVKKGVEIKKMSEGMSWNIGRNHFQFISPIKDYKGEENHGSIVLWSKIGGKNWIFSGDLDESGETRLINKYHNLKADILKIGHHGSNTSTSENFIKAVSPKIGIISVGAKNTYGHPKLEVLNRLKKYKVKILRTDQHGAIIYEYKGGQGTIYTFKAYRKTKERNEEGN
ncbi:DNA internalization-related competence protein ComEC/Rec2 [Bacillus sp. AFS041924]|uniref:DNA internalization-related competence protein ComEC/Rec2 n=1 Tax=Bacillus sp. AFS041924 TaxID=2033503 RepID=UPI000BFC6DDC|nr:DNA internalization-related competence protein ComEC/Rec2 [Bacillus sp. AFS041924]PGS48979.1 DNA internalization-related competence protein ComEC/Rec2 [Bacillus sp. AFS041924]